MKRKPETLTPAEARLEIIQAANRFKIRLHARHQYQARLFGSRHIQRAVSVCRSHRLVSPELLKAAGFRGDR